MRELTIGEIKALHRSYADAAVRALEAGYKWLELHYAHGYLGIPVATSWNLGVPQNADRVIREQLIDLVMLGRPALANPHWPVWAARELGHASPFSLVQQDWRWWLENFRGHAPSIGWPEVSTASA